MSISDPYVLPRTLRSIALASSISLICGGMAQAAEDEEAAKLDKVQVTGSHIKRTDIEGPSPVVVIDREEIDRTGATTVSELLRNLPYANGPSFDEKFTNSFAPGSSGVSLRGLGQNATLVLLDGRRVSNYGFSQNITESFVDLNSIPLGAVDRVEILKDGASALYGSDAIAGVINIILKKDYEGAEVSLGYGGTDKNDGEETELNFITGVSNNKSNLTFNFNHFERKPINLLDREFSKSANHTDQGGKGNGLDFRSFGNPVANVLSVATFNVLAPINVFDYNPYITAVPETERTGTLLNYNYDINRNVSLYSQISYNQVITDAQSAPTPTFGTNDNVIVSAGQAFNTYGEDVYVFWRMLEAGPRKSHIETDAGRAVVGLNGTLFDWDWDAAAVYGRSKTVDTGTNFVNRIALINAIDNDEINPFGTTSNDPEVFDGLKASTSRTGITTTTSYNAKTSGEVVSMPAGPLSLAVGLERRYETLKDTPDKLSEEGQIIGSGGTSANGSRDLTSGFVEFGVPVVESLELQLALRHENYSDFGTTTNPKVALRYQPLRSLMFRASYGTGFRAPSLPELFLGDSVSFNFVEDTTRCAITGAPADCGGSQYKVVFGGNPDLDPEDSKSFYIGTVWEPLKKLSIGLDLWRYEHTDVIDSVEDQYILDNEADFPGAVVRGTPQFAGDPGPILQINNSFINLADQETQGLDLEVNYTHKLGNAGTFILTERATYVDEFDRKPFPDADFEELAGTYQYPRLRSTTQVGWQRGMFGVTFAGDYISSYEDANTNEITGETEKVDYYLTFRTQFVADASFGKFTVGIDNMFDEEPPFANDEIEGYDYATHDPRGRYYYARYGLKF